MVAAVFVTAGIAGRVQAVSYDDQVANWRMTDGLPSNKITAALQTRDGYIWAGTFDGLARFDGVAFTLFDAGRMPGMVDSSVTALCESPDGALWIGHGAGSVTRLRDGTFTYFPTQPAHEDFRIQNLAWDEHGDVWALDTRGLLFRVRDRLSLVPEKGTALGVYVMAGSPGGAIGIVARGRLSVFEHGTLHPEPARPELEPYVQGVSASRDGGWWIVAGGHLWKRKADQSLEDHGPVPTRSYPVYSMTELSDGRVAGASYDAGGWIGDPASHQYVRFSRSAHFSSDWVTAVFEDREGGVWLGTGTAGLCRLGKPKVRMLRPADALNGRAVLAVAAAPNGDIWAGTEGSAIYRYHGDEWTRFGPEQGLANRYVWSVAAGSDGTMWAGTWGSGVFRFDGNRFVGADSATEAAQTAVAAVLPSRDGTVLVGGLSGVYRWDGHQVRWLEPGPNRTLTNVRALLEQGDVVWAGCWGHGLGKIGGGNLQRFTHADGLSSDYVNCLYRDRAGALWIGTQGGGVNRFADGHFAVVNTANGLADNSIGGIAEDNDGGYWLSSKAGLMRVGGAQLNACADGTLPRVDCETLGYSDGLTTLNFSTGTQPTITALADGRLAFATDAGVALLNPADRRSNRLPPPVLIEWIKAGERIMPAKGKTTVYEIPPGFGRLEIKYTALSFAGPDKVVFRRQLTPLEPEPTITRSERSVAYNYIPAGRYSFHVTASNNDGVWNQEGRDVTLVVLPYFWETVWFRLLVALVLLGGTAAAVWSVSRRRLKRRIERLEQETAIERERTRIANDMHDDLGSQLTRITLLSESAQRQCTDTERVRERLGQIYRSAHDLTKAMDEIVWTVNPKHDTLESLLAYIESFALELLGAADIACRVDAPFETAGWAPSSEVRHNLFLCVKEALTNVIRHSGADTVLLTVRLENGMFSVRVADNGRGCRPAAEQMTRPGGGNGLCNLRARMARIGGTCEIAPGADGGCVVTLIVPISPEIAPTHINL